MELNICFTQGGDNMPFLLEDRILYLKDNLELSSTFLFQI